MRLLPKVPKPDLLDVHVYGGATLTCVGIGLHDVGVALAVGGIFLTYVGLFYRGRKPWGG